jgi:hypothetical protein
MEGFAYRNVFPVPPNPLFMGQCQTEGILGSVSALAGNLQANMVLNSLLGLSELSGKIFHMNTKSGVTYSLNYDAKSIATPENTDAILTFNYEAFCRNFNP